ncbi:hypothetical protein VPAL9027_02296 [Vibrio palustris]|uniref:Uncharacterized protein n=1 Tax=Vibrio palustris TaxID=1918946 RepID=A0A1R4B5W9_9VIBR|nr:hypothetical protein VPAL9027_02296 [Vibrio palustris]
MYEIVFMPSTLYKMIDGILSWSNKVLLFLSDYLYMGSYIVSNTV